MLYIRVDMSAHYGDVVIAGFVALSAVCIFQRYEWADLIGKAGTAEEGLNYFFNNFCNSGIILNKSPTIPISAILKIGADSSLFIAIILPEPIIPAVC